MLTPTMPPPTMTTRAWVFMRGLQSTRTQEPVARCIPSPAKRGRAGGGDWARLRRTEMRSHLNPPPFRGGGNSIVASIGAACRQATASVGNSSMTGAAAAARRGRGTQAGVGEFGGLAQERPHAAESTLGNGAVAQIVVVEEF